MYPLLAAVATSEFDLAVVPYIATGVAGLAYSAYKVVTPNTLDMNLQKEVLDYLKANQGTPQRKTVRDFVGSNPSPGTKRSYRDFEQITPAKKQRLDIQNALPTQTFGTYLQKARVSKKGRRYRKKRRF